ncbi:asparagine synthase-related protein [Antarcticibacterium sp. 1MA-6-2]|uniref:asparagine synthase-related protein n=1 Tax=Antarcticibacterium sp. 1MA-6-2 TaxID=2908210 RepID=UPI001F20002B|nr:asparagine synthase-related protein [Antarcticibacterium sp. 1MA-6-2]UJH91310.1 asparagine synthase-related protein [Antarcticibacterium sp. 1MA-6-2]
MDKWAVTLSGGHDSRAIAFLLQKCKTYQSPLKTITWGAESSLADAQSDAYVSEKVSEVLKTEHRFFSTELPEVPLENIISRFIQNGEGRIDHIPAYLDGFKLWKRIFEAGIEGIIRGDEIFGYNQIYSPLVVKSFMGLTLCSDYSNLKKYDYINSLKQEMPEILKQQRNESLPTWRDRIFQLYRIPYIQSSLADIKYPYIEQINPFLSKRIVEVIRTMPDSLRTNKRLFKKVMKQWALGVPFAQRASTLKFTDILRQEDFVELIKKELSSDYAKKIFPETFLNEVIKNIKKGKQNESQQKRGAVDRLKGLIPLKIKTYLAQQKSSLHLDENKLAFRIFIICRMHKELSS